jgi:hypothetical protein
MVRVTTVHCGATSGIYQRINMRFRHLTRICLIGLCTCMIIDN